jgi:hypothetical protein
MQFVLPVAAVQLVFGQAEIREPGEEIGPNICWRP